MFAVNYLAVVASVIAFMVLGFLWYGPLFGQLWMKQIGIKKEDINPSDATKGMVVSLVMGFVGALTIAVFARLAGISGAVPGLLLGLSLSVGLVATTLASNYMYESRSFGLFVINASYRVLCFTVAGLIIGAW